MTALPLCVFRATIIQRLLFNGRVRLHGCDNHFGGSASGQQGVKDSGGNHACHSSGVRPPLALLQGMQAVLRLSRSLDPPWMSGMT